MIARLATVAALACAVSADPRAPWRQGSFVSQGGALRVRGGAGGLGPGQAGPAGPALSGGAAMGSDALRGVLRTKGGAAGSSGGAMSTSSAIFSIFKNIVGAGVLALPAGMAAGKGTGMVPAVVLTLGLCFIASRTFGSFGRSIDATGATSFPDLWARTIGPKTTWVPAMAVLFLSVGASLAYVCILGDVFSSLIPSLSRTQAILAIASLVLMPLVLLRDLSALSFSSILGFAAVMYTAVFVVLRAVDGTYAEGGKYIESLDLAPGTDQVSGGRLSPGSLVLVNMLLTAYMAHMNGPRFYLELEDRSPENFQAISNKAFGLSGSIYVAVMVAGYYTFGKSSQGVILNNYSGSDSLAFAARVANGISIMTSFPILFTSARDALLSSLEGTSVGNAVASSDGAWKVFSVALLAAIVGLGIVVTDVGFVVSLQGSLLGALLCFSIPSLMYIGAMEKSGKADSKNLSLWKMMSVAGVFLLFFGTTITCLETFTDLLE